MTPEDMAPATSNALIHELIRQYGLMGVLLLLGGIAILSAVAWLLREWISKSINEDMEKARARIQREADDVLARSRSRHLRQVDRADEITRRVLHLVRIATEASFTINEMAELPEVEIDEGLVAKLKKELTGVSEELMDAHAIAVLSQLDFEGDIGNDLENVFAVFSSNLRDACEGLIGRAEGGEVFNPAELMFRSRKLNTAARELMDSWMPLLRRLNKTLSPDSASGGP